ncbi:hypothetical protein [Devosia submarina]|uniref:hypothetical protein n=1 Tax=Devosia submarina TaxID=1173082 RepID=UPI000D3813DF|nr:hypothetical protein [Devosia submarina]
MRIALLVCFALLALPAFAIGWSSYENGRFGYQSAIPPGFSGYGESENGDGRIYDRPGTMQTLSLWGAHMLAESFEAEVAASIGYAERDGFNISFQTVTPQWAVFSGVMGDRQFTRRMILLCDRMSTASMTLQFSSRDAADIRDIEQRLAQEFRTTGC